MKKKNTRVCCADGFSMSVQASANAYCSPRDDTGPYEAVEIGYPSAYEPMIAKYAEDPDNPTETVYGWVPADKVSLIIVKHGGIISGEVPDGIPHLKVPATS